MKISVATAGQEARSPVPGELKDAKYLFIVDVDRFEVTEVLPVPAEKPDLWCAEQTVARDCEAILCGKIDKDAFEVLAKASVSRYEATGLDATRAVKAMNAYTLPVIREYTGGPGCGGAHAARKRREQGEDFYLQEEEK